MMQKENENKIRRHSKLDLESSTHVVLKGKRQQQAWKTLKQVQGDNAYLMSGLHLTYNGNGFTLIELLVVVLIIGILAAVALPQYQKAVWKSRYTQAKIMAKSMANAEEIYYLANGTYTTDFEELSIDLPATSISNIVHGAYFSWGACGIYNVDGRSEVGCTLTKNGNAYIRYWLGLNHSVYRPGIVACLAYGTSGKPLPGDINYQICKSDTKSNFADSWGDNTYGWYYNE